MYKNFKAYIINLYKSKNYPMIVIWSIIGVLTSLIAAEFSSEIFMSLLNFLDKKIGGILFFLGTCYIANSYMKNLREKNNKKISEENKNKQIISREANSNNYIALRKCLFELLTETAEVLNLQCPQNLSSLDSPTKFIEKGELCVYQYIVLKKGEADVKSIENVLRTSIHTKLRNFTFEGIKQTSHIYDGFSYDIIQLYQVKDIGSYIQIELYFANDKTIDLINKRKRLLMDELYHDLDNNDNDF